MTGLITSDQTITEASAVTLHFALKLEDGALIDGTAVDQPATFRMGDGSLLPGFEQRLLGLRAGDERTFDLAPEEAFGEHQALNLRELPRAQFDGLEQPLEEGLMVSFASPEGELPGLITAVGTERVTIDFNHPLAGRQIRFEVTIVAVDAAETPVAH
ncbi:MAG: FKBP-type peptidyl-prolyl cis-trans isomerase [Pseudomonadota bacterium]